jgi:hypothetical protein
MAPHGNTLRTYGTGFQYGLSNEKKSGTVIALSNRWMANIKGGKQANLSED